MRKRLLCLFVITAVMIPLFSLFTVNARRSEIKFIDNCGIVSEGEYFTGIPEECASLEILERLTDSNDVFVKDSYGVVCENEDFVGTGYTLNIIQHSVVNKRLTAVVSGDINGDGKVAAADYMKLKKAFAGDISLTGAYMLAADINADGKFGTADYIRVKLYIDGRYQLSNPLPDVVSGNMVTPTSNPESLGDSVEYGNQVKNQVQTYFNQGGDRSYYIMENAEMKLSHSISDSGNKNISSFENKEGGVYFTDSMDIYFRKNGETYPLSQNVAKPLNTRWGQYYSESHIRGFDFLEVTDLMDITYNILPDSLHVSYKLIYANDYAEETAFGFVWNISKDTVLDMEFKDKNGVHNNFDDIDPSSVEYIAFDIKNAGVVALVFATDATCTVNSGGDETYYSVSVEMTSEAATSGDEKSLNYQLYSDCTHNFDGVREASCIERNPVEVYVTDGENGRGKPVYMGYDSSRGMYHIREKGSVGSFNFAYKNPNVYTYANIKIVNDEHERPVWIWVNSPSGGLECASILDKEGNLTAIPTEVCKNFNGEYEDPVYDSKDTAYGDTIFPLYTKADETKECTAVQYMQNWGKYALKQISSIQYIASYYHISTGVSETTCIAPLGVKNKDGWILADFRGISGKIWDSQPQFHHAGNTHFTCTKNAQSIRILTEYTGSELISTGPTYGEVKYSYISDNGKYKYTLTHLEFPQRDESRNYYTVELEFLEDYSLEDARRQLELLYWNHPNGGFRSLTYKGTDGTDVTITGMPGRAAVLSKGSSYFTFHNSVNSEITNYGVIIKDYNIICGGEVWDGNLRIDATTVNGIDNYKNTLSLTPNQRKMDFVKGDTIRINMILLPYGEPEQTHYDNVVRVYEDSVLKPMEVSAATGSVVEHEYMALVRAENNVAEFTMSGSRNMNTVRIDGFKSSTKPVIQEYVNGEWVEYDTSVESFDGYGVQYMDDNTYSFSFVVDMGDAGTARTFKINQ